MPLYVPRWMPFSEALDHVNKADLRAALCDRGVVARFADNGEMIDAVKWWEGVVLINYSEPLFGDGRGIVLCRAHVEKLARETKGPIRAGVPGTEAASIGADEVVGATSWTLAPDPAYPIRERHSAYEWSMTLGAEVHPYGHCIADRFGSNRELRAGTVAGMQARERAVEGWSDQARAIYCVLKAEFEAGRIEPLRRAWCLDPAGVDSPVPDFSRYVFGIEEVLQLIRRRGDTGKLIGELLAAQDRTADTVPPEPDTIALALQDTCNVPDVVAADTALAEWIFSQHPEGGARPLTREKLISKAQSKGFPFTTLKFNRAYREVYASEDHRPPRQGWPLKEPYRSRLKT
jgi:hypothetical protein